MNKTAEFLVKSLRLMLQIIGTCVIGIWLWEKATSIPVETWGWMALIIVITIAVIFVWFHTIANAVKKRKSGR